MAQIKKTLRVQKMRKPSQNAQFEHYGLPSQC